MKNFALVHPEPLSPEPNPGLLRLRLPIPFPPGHVNVWLLRDGPGWAAIDAGFGDSRTRDIWDAVLAHPLLQGLSLTRLVVTHAHIDHVGCAGWLCGKLGLVPEMARAEWLTWRATAAEDPAELRAFQMEHLARAGCAPERLAHFGDQPLAPPGNQPVTRGYKRRQAGERIGVGNDQWEVLAGSGHAPEMLMLHCRERKIFIAADQVLPRITPFVGVMARDPWNNPLHEFLTTLEGMPDLPADTLVLPSHGEPFHGAADRIEALKAHHYAELEKLRRLCRRPHSAYEAALAMFPRIDDHNFSMAVTEALAHLRHLELRGELLAAVDNAGVERFHAPPD